MAMLAAFVCGLLFGIGLLISGMTQPEKILNFLDVAGIAKGTWDPSLAFVMIGALAFTWIGYGAARRRGAPALTPQSFWPTRTDIDGSLIAGSVLFGIGWGLVGLCPGPAIVNFVTLNAKVFVFVAAMIVGMMLHDRWWAPMSYRRRYTTGAAEKD